MMTLKPYIIIEPGNLLPQATKIKIIEQIMPKNGHNILCLAPAMTENTEPTVAINVNHVVQLAYGFSSLVITIWTMKKTMLNVTLSQRMICSGIVNSRI
ncbi:MAG: hypothetical protein MJ233_02945 [Mycoplasmoidaceae bacterium]|nr:hypothetical protein [Mycoplasmoidaceae bacterium]